MLVRRPHPDSCEARQRHTESLPFREGAEGLRLGSGKPIHEPVKIELAVDGILDETRQHVTAIPPVRHQMEQHPMKMLRRKLFADGTSHRTGRQIATIAVA